MTANKTGLEKFKEYWNMDMHSIEELSRKMNQLLSEEQMVQEDEFEKWLEDNFNRMTVGTNEYQTVDYILSKYRQLKGRK